MASSTSARFFQLLRCIVTNGAIVIHTQRLKSDPGGNLLS
ncbi:chemotaxis protein [Escherichia coli]|nr:chemotaxis protein [Escherichia coli]